MKEIWRNEYEDVWVEQDGENLLFYGQGEEQKDRDLIVVTMEELVEIVNQTEDPDELGYASIEISEDFREKQGGKDD